MATNNAVDITDLLDVLQGMEAAAGPRVAHLFAPTRQTPSGGGGI